MQGQERRRQRDGVEDQRVLHRLVADQQVVVDLHDHHAPGRNDKPGSRREVDGPGARRPVAQQGGLREVVQRRVGKRSLPEARPAILEHLVPSGLGHQ